MAAGSSSKALPGCCFYFGAPLYQMRKQTIAQLGFKPGTFWRHHSTAVGYIKQLLYAYRVQAECCGHFATAHAFFQLGQATYATNKINTFIGARVLYVQVLCQYIILQNAYVQNAYGVGGIGVFF